MTKFFAVGLTVAIARNVAVAIAPSNVENVEEAATLLQTRVAVEHAKLHHIDRIKDAETFLETDVAEVTETFEKLTAEAARTNATIQQLAPPWCRQGGGYYCAHNCRPSYGGTDYKCAYNYGTPVEGVQAWEVCPREVPLCQGYKHGTSWGRCTSKCAYNFWDGVQEEWWKTCPQHSPYCQDGHCLRPLSYSSSDWDGKHFYLKGGRGIHGRDWCATDDLLECQYNGPHYSDAHSNRWSLRLQSVPGEFNTWAIRGGSEKKYCGDTDSGVLCNKDNIGQWEKFTIWTKSVHIGCLNHLVLKNKRWNRYCTPRPDGMTCDAQGIDKYEVLQAVVAEPVDQW